jgi:hypothetical protein
MNKITLLMLAVILTSCGKSEPADTVDSLVAHPDRLREVEKACSDDYAKMGAAECNTASSARHRLFIGNGPQYTSPKDPPKF